MNRKTLLKTTLLCGFIALSLGGWLLHFRIHSPILTGYSWVPFTSGVLSLILLTFLFSFRSTLAYAYVINGMLIIIATITMAHFSIANLPGPITLKSIIFGTLLADISIAWGKFAIGKALFDLELMRTDQDTVPRGRYFRYPNTGWWMVHLLALSIVYALGHILWK